MIRSILKKKRILFLIIIIVVLFILTWGMSDTQNSATVFSGDSDPWSEGWIQIAEDGEQELSNISEFENLSTAGTLVFENVIPDLVEDKVLFFYSKDLEVKVWVGGELLYSFEMEENLEFLETPGNKWNQIDIPDELSGETIRIELSSNFINRYTETLTGLYLIDAYEAKDIVIRQDWVMILMTIILFTMTIDTFINSFLWKSKHINDYFIRLGAIVFCVFIWTLGMSGILDLFLHNPILSYLCSMLTLPLIPVVVFESLSVVYPEKFKRLQLSEMILWANFFIQLILQFAFGISLMDLLPITIAIYIAGSLTILYMVIRYIIDYIRDRENQDRELNIPFVSLIIIFIGVIIECAINILLPKMINIIGLASISSFLLYLTLNKYVFSYVESKTDTEKKIIEHNYKNLQNTTAVQQIQAHFFFNTLNAISALCKQDARKADDAIRLFASYMRTFMHFINEQKIVPFMEEIKLIEGLLAIHELRYPKKYTYHFNLEYTEFEIPPLSIQPIVENALEHGLKALPSGGILEIGSYRLDDVVHIIIEDNGMGFDIAKLEKTKRIGIANMKKRIEIMVHGTVCIESVHGKGTKVIIEIPLENSRNGEI